LALLQVRGVGKDSDTKKLQKRGPRDKNKGTITQTSSEGKSKRGSKGVFLRGTLWRGWRREAGELGDYPFSAEDGEGLALIGEKAFLPVA